ncbi:hypothetical protein Bca4012_072562 [Brassica carinata]
MDAYFSVPAPMVKLSTAHTSITCVAVPMNQRLQQLKPQQLHKSLLAIAQQRNNMLQQQRGHSRTA